MLLRSERHSKTTITIRNQLNPGRPSDQEYSKNVNDTVGMVISTTQMRPNSISFENFCWWSQFFDYYSRILLSSLHKMCTAAFFFQVVTDGNLKLNEALRACCLQGIVSFLLLSLTTMSRSLGRHSRVLRKDMAWAMKVRLSMIAPLAELTALLLPTSTLHWLMHLQRRLPAAATWCGCSWWREALAAPIVKRQKSAGQVTEATAESKERNDLCNQERRFKLAFKKGTE